MFLCVFRSKGEAGTVGGASAADALFGVSAQGANPFGAELPAAMNPFGGRPAPEQAAATANPFGDAPPNPFVQAPAPAGSNPF